MREHLEDLAQYPKHWPCMSFSNHDVVRTVTRFGGGEEGNPALAKLMLALLFGLRGAVLMYQGEELGLPETDLPRHLLRDPVGDLYYPVAKGRDGCRTPMPWDAKAANLGFSNGTPWLPLSPYHKRLAVSEQVGDADSTLAYTRHFLAVRKKSAALTRGDSTLLDAPDPVLAFVRTEGAVRVLCVFNMSDGDATFRYADIAAATSMDIGCGNVVRKGDGVALGPFAAWFGAL
jgi:alpha-glucosidase